MTQTIGFCGLLQRLRRAQFHENLLWGGQFWPQAASLGGRSRATFSTLPPAPYHATMKPDSVPDLDRITRNPQMMGGSPGLRGMRVTVGMIVGLVAEGRSPC